MSAAPCGSGELVREASTAERKMIVLPGIVRSTRADSWLPSIAEPLTRTMLGAG